MYRGTLNLGAADPYGLKMGHWGDGSGATYLVDDVEQSRAGLLGIEFIGHCPSGRFGGRTQSLLLVHPINLDDYPVGSNREVLAFLVPKGEKILDLVCCFAALRPSLLLRRDRESPSSQTLHGLGVRSKWTLAGVGRVGKHAEAALGNLSRVLHFKGS